MVNVDTLSGIEMIVSAVTAVIGCSILWSVSSDSVGGVPDKNDGAHHAFNYIVAGVPVALICNVITTLQHSHYLRIVHFAALGITGYLMTGIGAGDPTMATIGFSEEEDATNSLCSLSRDSNKCMPINPISFAMITLWRIKIAADNDLSSGDRKIFSGAMFCWISLIVGLFIPVRYNIDQSGVIFKVIFWIAGLVCAVIGIVVLSTQDQAVSPLGSVGGSYLTSMQIIGFTLFIQMTSTVAFLSTDHTVARFTAAVCGFIGWFIPSAMFTIVVLADQNNASDEELADIRVGGLFCWFSSIAHVFACACMLGGEDHGDRWRESVSQPTNTQFKNAAAV